MNLIQPISTSLPGQKAQFLYQEAEMCFRQGNPQEAIALCQEIIKLQPDFALGYQRLGHIWRSQGKLSPSLRCYLKARELQPNLISADFWLDLGSEFSEHNHLNEAKLCYNTALQIDPTHAKSYLNLGVMYRRKGDLIQAIALYQKAIALHPTLHSAYFNLGNVFLEQERLDEAVAAYLEALMIQPDFESAYRNLGQTLLRQDRIENALSCALHFLPFSLIKDYYPAASDSFIASHSVSYRDLNFVEIHLKNSVKLSPPQTPDGSLHPNFNWMVHINPETFAVTLPLGRAWGDSYTTAALTSDGRFLDEFCQGSALSIAISPKLPPVTPLKGTAAFLSVRGGNTYYHWMADLLPRIQLLKLAETQLDPIKFFVVNSCHLPFQRETLSLLGIPAHKIIESSKHPHIQAPTLVVPSLPGDVGLISQWTCEFLRQAFLGKAAVGRSPTPERILISRRHASYRRLLNEDEAIARLSPHGFVPIALESLSFLEQVALFAGAKVIIAPHGAGLTNTVFCNPGTKLIEIFSPDAVSVNYWLIANIIGLEYYYLIAEPLEEYNTPTSIPKRNYNHPLYEDIVINLDSLLNIMQFSNVI